jgi:glycosyltransferase involved in cell wall biosynthesis
MRLTFISNFLNHHQLPICNEFYNLLGDNFKFVACEKVPEDRISMGYKKEFDVNYLIDGTIKENVLETLYNSDVLIAGSCPYEYMKIFIDAEKPFFLYAERMFKNGTWHKYSPLARYNMHNLYNKVFNDNMYLLCSSAYTASDFNDFNSFKNHYLKWGYFPALSKFSYKKIKENKIKNSIIWVGRLLDWKHPEQAVLLAKFLKDYNIDFKLTMIGGSGNYKNKIDKLINNHKLNNDITLLSNLHFTEVRRLMEESEIFIFTSDFNEGWGAVLNEAMSSACACVASYKAGSVPFLLNKSNGQIYNSRQDDLNNKVLKYIRNKALLDKHSKEAYDTITNLWNYKVAANNFIKFASDLYNKKNPTPSSIGPVSKAKIITNKMGKELITE